MYYNKTYLIYNVQKHQIAFYRCRKELLQNIQIEFKLQYLSLLKKKFSFGYNY